MDKECVIVVSTGAMISAIRENLRRGGENWSAVAQDGQWLFVEMKNSGVLALKEYLKELSGDNLGGAIGVKAHNDADVSATMYELQYLNGMETCVFPPELTEEAALSGELRREWGVESTGAYPGGQPAGE
ncbi:MAG TPA: hypothetical protein VLA21_08730 [Candidatus Limnocylindria bacterium]|nr:hypothetical protein [Candidatus Limnocylindria bacterium]